MRVNNGKKILLILGVITLFLAIPISTTFAQIVMKGDPDIECNRVELALSKDEITTQEYSSNTDIIYDLNVELIALKHTATTVNATLRFKDKASLLEEQTFTGEKNNPIILQEQAKWDIIGFREAKISTVPFQIKGFAHLPEKIEFELDVEYRNPNDENTYTKTLSLIPGIPDTTINIVGISDPPDKPKGEKIPITVTIENTGSDYSIAMVIQIKIQSIRAYSSFNPSNYAPYRNAAGPIVLTEMFTFFDNIAPGAQKDFSINFNFAHSNGAMNVGLWRIIEVVAQAANSEYDIMSVTKDFIVTAKSLGSGPHAVFIYYLWNAEGPYSEFEENPRTYFEHTTYGNIKAGLYMFKKQYNQRSDNYIDHNMIICCDDNSFVWPYPEGLYAPPLEQISIEAYSYIGSKLNLNGGVWMDGAYALYVDNCGFDLLLVAFGYKCVPGGQCFSNNMVVVAGAGPANYFSQWKYNIDGLVQHEISHCFGCFDYETDPDEPPLHPLKKCIMVYKDTIRYVNYLYEKLIWSLIYINDPTNNWCTGTTNGECTNKFDDTWDQYYIPKTVDTPN